MISSLKEKNGVISGRVIAHHGDREGVRFAIGPATLLAVETDRNLWLVHTSTGFEHYYESDQKPFPTGKPLDVGAAIEITHYKLFGTHVGEKLLKEAENVAKKYGATFACGGAGTGEDEDLPAIRKWFKSLGWKPESVGYEYGEPDRVWKRLK